MEYSIRKLAKLAGVSTRALRYYDEIGLLRPTRINRSGRIYGQWEVDLLHQILLYREMDMPLAEIKRIVLSKDFGGKPALENHLCILYNRKKHLDLLIENVERTIAAMKGEVTMNDEEKFACFKRDALKQNEEQFGREIREKYGHETVEASNKKYLSMTREQNAELERLTGEFHQTLKAAFDGGDPSGGLAQRACELHKKWLCFYWARYSKEAHLGITQMYVDDPRFAAHYDTIAPGAARFLRDAVLRYCK
jgi:DNA-binding transcriptional MerR regulator